MRYVWKEKKSNLTSCRPSIVLYLYSLPDLLKPMLVRGRICECKTLNRENLWSSVWANFCCNLWTNVRTCSKRDAVISASLLTISVRTDSTSVSGFRSKRSIDLLQWSRDDCFILKSLSPDCCQHWSFRTTPGLNTNISSPTIRNIRFRNQSPAFEYSHFLVQRTYLLKWPPCSYSRMIPGG